MSDKEKAHWLNRDEPARVPVEELQFDKTYQCLAEHLVENVGNPNSAGGMPVVSYGEAKPLPDSRIEQLVGCTSCRAICTLVIKKPKVLGPGTEDDPNIVLSLAPAPDPNPWYMSGNFDDCRKGRLKVPSEGYDLVKTQKQQYSTID